jgi:hypothetical protein
MGIVVGRTDDWSSSAAGDTPEQLYGFWEAAVERSRASSTRPWLAAVSMLVHVASPEGACEPAPLAVRSVEVRPTHRTRRPTSRGRRRTRWRRSTAGMAPDIKPSMTRRDAAIVAGAPDPKKPEPGENAAAGPPCRLTHGHYAPRHSGCVTAADRDTRRAERRPHAPHDSGKAIRDQRLSLADSTGAGLISAPVGHPQHRAGDSWSAADAICHERLKPPPLDRHVVIDGRQLACRRE